MDGISKYINECLCRLHSPPPGGAYEQWLISCEQNLNCVVQLQAPRPNAERAFIYLFWSFIYRFAIKYMALPLNIWFCSKIFSLVIYIYKW